jgi:hypothetical protein
MGTEDVLCTKELFDFQISTNDHNRTSDALKEMVPSSEVLYFVVQ